MVNPAGDRPASRADPTPGTTATRHDCTVQRRRASAVDPPRLTLTCFRCLSTKDAVVLTDDHNSLLIESVRAQPPEIGVIAERSGRSHDDVEVRAAAGAIVGVILTEFLPARAAEPAARRTCRR